MSDHRLALGLLLAAATACRCPDTDPPPSPVVAAQELDHLAVSVGRVWLRQHPEQASPFAAETQVEEAARPSTTPAEDAQAWAGEMLQRLDLLENALEVPADLALARVLRGRLRSAQAEVSGTEVPETLKLPRPRAVAGQEQALARLGELRQQRSALLRAAPPAGDGENSRPPSPASWTVETLQQQVQQRWAAASASGGHWPAVELPAPHWTRGDSTEARRLLRHRPDGTYAIQLPATAAPALLVRVEPELRALGVPGAALALQLARAQAVWPAWQRALQGPALWLGWGQWTVARELLEHGAQPAPAASADLDWLLLQSARAAADAGLHGLAQSRAQLRQLFTGHCGLDEAAADAELDRIARRPGEALAAFEFSQVFAAARTRGRQLLDDRLDEPALWAALLTTGPVDAEGLRAAVATELRRQQDRPRPRSAQ